MSTISSNAGSSSRPPQSPLANLDMGAPSGVEVLLRQTGALVLDSYRELSARKLFWLSVIISGIAVVVFALIGINDKGLTLLGYNLGIPYVSTAIMTPAFFYKTVFFSLGFSIWLTWAATILAIVSTAGIIPEFVASGSIDLSLSKPIGRMRLFLTKYCCALLFVGLQVAVFSVASYLVIGFRGGTWEPGLFWAVPLVLAMFSFLYCVCALIGLLTRSAIAALLLTMLFWFAIFIVDRSEAVLLSFRLSYASGVQLHDERIRQMEGKLGEMKLKLAADPHAFDSPQPKAAPQSKTFASLIGGLLRGKKPEGETFPPVRPAAPVQVPDSPASEPATTSTDPADVQDDGQPETGPAQRQSNAERMLAKLKTPKDVEAAIARWTATRADITGTRDALVKWHQLLYGTKTFLPKTSETLGLLERVLFSSDELASWSEGAEKRSQARGRGQVVGEIRISEARMVRAHDEELRSRSVWWVLGTSVGFEILVLGVATFVFVRRAF